MSEPSAEAARVTAVPVRHWGRWLSAAVVLTLLAWFALAASRADIRYGVIPGYLRNPTILAGLRMTLVISVLAQGLGIVLGVLFAVLRLSKNPVLSSISGAYIWFFRGTPVLVQLTFWFSGVPLVFQTLTIAVPFTDIELFSTPMTTFMTAFMAALLGLGLNEGAYMAEIVRAGIISVDQGQTEAAQALGLTSGKTMRRIVLPQAMRVIIPPTGNEFISMLKTSSLATVVTLGELFRRASDISSTNLLVVELLITVSIWYLVLTTVASVGQFYLERRFARGAARQLPDTPLQRVRRNLTTLGRRPRGETT